ncbi:NUDIX domain-containing protein [Rhodococcus coprophilus]|uniref:Nudix superfamily hydrolase n=1 Tax=Rhodococcus coprophilus TaxID=38310 RepID=A0A2X4TQ43_9NOCA|nr:NUDIX domain-containing protein [Rhodococcus coprophilus]MBM7461194.1 8-oxo-dGTP pyrophosphatase MutT (NUDIX family) [Rhodococcus coprophilus]SQI29023.1 nudix superfamily hydrolase [Rhodococcus coprophilus]
MTLSALTILVLALVAALVITVGFWAYSVANRLDRLHVRSDLSWLALDAALARRAVVARSIAASISATEGRNLAHLADAAERADRTHREDAENALSAALAKVDTDRLRSPLVAELADAEARVLIARRFHNDAVRDTLALRTRRTVQWLHLGGTAPLPTYFEIAERAGTSVPVSATPTATGTPTQNSPSPVPDRMRTSARVVLLDDAGRVLLLRGHDPATPDSHFWFTVGGAVEPGESLLDAAIREVTEETGLHVEPEQVFGPMWRRVAVFPFNGEVLHSEELFFAVQVPAFEPGADGFTELERRMHLEHRWFDPSGVRELVQSGESVYPQDLPRLLDEARAVAARHRAPEVRAIR